LCHQKLQRIYFRDIVGIEADRQRGRQRDKIMGRQRGSSQAGRQQPSRQAAAKQAGHGQAGRETVKLQ
jgi:hypothetical protein